MLAQEGFLLGCFHALGDSRKPQCLSQAAD